MKTFDPTTKSDSDDKRFDPLKPVQTRDGRKARILCTDLNGQWPIVAAVLETNHVGKQYEMTLHFGKDGVFCGNMAKTDLVNVPVKVERWINIYPDGQGNYFTPILHKDKILADRDASPDRIACLKIEWELP